MRFFITATAFFATVSAAALWQRQNVPTSPPTCSDPCFNTGTNNISLGSCGASDLACLCKDPVYLQAVINCVVSVCDNINDVDTALQFSGGYCGVAGVNTFPTTLTTGVPGTPTHTPGTNGSAATTSSTTSTTATQSHGAALNLKAPAMGIAALVLAAAGLSL